MITKNQVIEAQKIWAEGIIKIGSLKGNRSVCQKFTSDFLDKIYAFDLGTVLFKPTKCSIEQFRQNKETAISYFIAGENKKCCEDYGFALAPWIGVRFENSGFILEENRAIAMGNYFFTDSDNNDVKVEFTFGYRLHNTELKIDLHHSSLPCTEH